MSEENLEQRQSEINRMLDDSDVFETGFEPVNIEELNKAPEKEVKPIEKSYDYLKNLASLLNEGEEVEDNKISFEDTIFTGKDEEGKEVEVKAIKNAIVKKILDKVTLGASQEVDAYVREVLAKSTEEGFDLEEYRASKSVSSAESSIDWSDTDSIVRMAYNAKYGKGTDADLTEEEIEMQVEKLSSADKKLLVADLRKAARMAEEAKAKEMADNEELNFKNRVGKYNDDIKRSIELFINETKNKEVFSGFRFAQSDKEEYIKEIPDFMKRELEKRDDGSYIAISKAEKVLQETIKTPESMLDLIPFLWMKSKGKLDAYSTFITEQVKADMLERLDDSPSRRIASTQGKEADLGVAFDEDVFETII